MAKTTTQAKRPRKITASPETIAQALRELGINKPFYTARVVGGRLELILYGGEVVYWPAAASKAKRPPRKGD